MREVTVAATQMACTWDVDANVANAMELVREAASRGANIVLIQELFETPYFPAEEREDRFALAKPLGGHPTIAKMSALARELEVVLPVSFFERAGNAYFNSLAIVDADGRVMGVYRKSHIPDGPGYEEKYYFNPGDTGFRVWRTRYGNIGAAICWDQWFPECARAMALQDAEIFLFPTSIGDEPQPQSVDSRGPWQRVMQGHAAANVIPVVASNRIGSEESATKLTFYGSSFITDETGEKVAEAPVDEQAVLTATFDLDALRATRASWGLFRDRRIDLYRGLLTLDGAKE
ncbi:MAG: N-carbamoylputrescine amidase [Deltaproteobacteria bacterium]|nr:N-carbamoylputrescine amidase [Deltaproteobacteria bacterium]MBW2398321.1 N-carbamoylputrescine amidase [Deltaproteobacteria bacterium]MBW2667681.1 N-carbamoylputrescine amidase [Deltaproteobacteria bacterium]